MIKTDFKRNTKILNADLVSEISYPLIPGEIKMKKIRFYPLNPLNPRSYFSLILNPRSYSFYRVKFFELIFFVLLQHIKRSLFMREEELNSIVYSKNVIEFITVANEFCSFLERSEEFESADFLARLQKILPLLYLKASLLPVFELEAEDDLEKFVTETDYNEIREKVLQHTGGNDEYQEVFVAGMQFSETALPASISENVADIYQEMKDLVMSFRTMNDEVMEQAIGECSNNFSNLWGQTLVNCMRAVHNVIYAENTEEDPKSAKKEFSKDSNKKNRKPDWLNDRFSYQGEE